MSGTGSVGNQRPMTQPSVSEGAPTKALSAGQKAAGFIGTLSAGSIVAGALVAVGVIGLSVMTAGIPLIVAGAVGLGASLYGAKKLADRKAGQADSPKPAQVEAGKAGEPAKKPSQSFEATIKAAKGSIDTAAGQPVGNRVGDNICRGTEVKDFILDNCSTLFAQMAATHTLAAVHVQLPDAAKNMPDNVCKLFAECEAHIGSATAHRTRTDDKTNVTTTDKADFIDALGPNMIGHPLNGYIMKNVPKDASIKEQMDVAKFTAALMSDFATGVRREPSLGNPSPWNSFMNTILERGRALLQPQDGTQSTSQHAAADSISRSDFKGNPSVDSQQNSGVVRNGDSLTTVHAASNSDNMSASNFSSSSAAPLTQRPETPENDSKGSPVNVHVAPKSVEKAPPGPQAVALTAAKASITNAVYLGSEVLSKSEFSDYVMKQCATQFDEIADLMTQKNSESLRESFAIITKKLPADVCKLFAECEKHIDDQLEMASRSNEKSAFLRGLLIGGLAEPLSTYLNNKEEEALEREDSFGASAIADARRNVEAGAMSVEQNSPWDGLLENILSRGRQELAR